MTGMAALSKICKYSETLSQMNSQEDADTLRLKGLKLVDNLKKSLSLVKQAPDFGGKTLGSKKSILHRKSNPGMKSGVLSSDDASTNYERGSILS